MVAVPDLDSVRFGGIKQKQIQAADGMREVSVWHQRQEKDEELTRIML